MSYRKILFLAAASGAIFCISFNSGRDSFKSYAQTQSHPPIIAVLYNDGQFTKSISEYKKRVGQKEKDGYLNLAIIYKDLGRYQKAVETLNRFVNIFGDDRRASKLLGRLYYLNAQPEKAVVILKKALKNNPQDLDIWINIGLCYVDLKKDFLAKQYFQKAVSMNNDSVIAHLSLADLYYRKEKLPQALREYNTVRLIDAGIQKIYRYVAEIFLKLGNLSEAFDMYQKIALLEPQNLAIEQKLDFIRSRLGKNYFEQRKKEHARQRKEKMVSVKPFKPTPDMIFVRIGLLLGKDYVHFRCSGPFAVEAQDGAVIINGLKGEDYSVSLKSKKSLVISSNHLENVTINETVIIRPLEPQATVTLFDVQLGKGNYWVNEQDRSYRGTMEIHIAQEGMDVINKVSLEEYLYSVIPSEMPSSWSKEALKAQAVAARSEAFKKLKRHDREGFNFCPEVHCQVYAGVEQETEATNQAVDETRGVTLVYRGQPVDAIYSSNCGGHTQDNIFANREEIPYLKGRIDAPDELHMRFPLSPLWLEDWLREPQTDIFCNLSAGAQNSNFRWVRLYTAEELNAMVNSSVKVGDVERIIISKRGPSGHIHALKIVGKNAIAVVESELNIRRIFGDLRSSMFKSEIKYSPEGIPQAFIFYGGGWGHGVGMCQVGSYGMAMRGCDFKKILSHYFQGAKLERIY